MLHGNYTVLNKLPLRFMGGSTTSVEPQLRSNWNTAGMARNKFYIERQTTSEKLYAIPQGGYPPVCWIIPQVAGNMAAHYTLNGVGAISPPNLAGGLNAASTIAGIGAIGTAAATMLMYGSATLAGVGGVTPSITALGNIGATSAGSGAVTGSINSVVNLAASLAGVGALSGALQAILAASSQIDGVGGVSANLSGGIGATATIAGVGSVSANVDAVWSMQASIGGSGSLSAAIQGLANCVSTMVGTGGLSVTAHAPGDMSATITTATALSPSTLAAAVWNAFAADFNTAQTMGNKLNGAGNAGDPWGTDLSAYADGTAGKLLVIATAILQNKQVTDPNTGIMTVYAPDGTTPIFTCQLYEDAGGSQTYRGQGAERRERLQ